MLNNKKILCLGNTTSETDELVTALAKKSNSFNFGLIASAEVDIINPGYYHTTLGDIGIDDMIDFVGKFDSIIVLNQPIESYYDPELYKITKQMIMLIQNIKKKPVEIIEPRDIL